MTEKNSGKTDMEENLICDLGPSDKDKSPNELGTEMDVTLEDKIKEFGLLGDMKATEEFLLNNTDFIHESTALALLKWCTALSDDPENVESFDRVSTQCLYILYLLDLARQVDIEPIYCVTPFFARISEPEFHEMFEKEIIPFRSRLQNSSWDEVIGEVLKGNSSDDESSLSLPSSSSDISVALDPLEMYKSLPPELQTCIDNEDIEALEAALNQLPDDEADTYMTRFLQAGLFIPIDNESGQDSDSESENPLDEAEKEAGENVAAGEGEDEDSQ
ncbi:hypothetical protein M8J76_008599 [Diaphorina citri]|nr:hypothetical protein M8J76_008599 [Diaphorina citri]KAI5728318.1 hypothetical protein M8J77_014643 [Diaphorina citri]